MPLLYCNAHQKRSTLTMVHQLSLVATLPHSSYVQTVSTLQALTGLALPQNISTYTLICKPINKFKPKFEPGKVNQTEQYFMKCITIWDDLEDIDLSNPYIDETIETQKLFGNQSTPEKEETTGFNKVWTLQISDIPVAGKNQACSAQNIFESTLTHNHISASRVKQDMLKEKEQKDKDSESELVDLNKEDETTKNSFIQFLNDLGYDTINQFWIKGIRFFHGDIVIEIFKVFIRDDTKREYPSNKIPLKLLDKSNSFQVKCFVNIPKATEIEQINQGTKELLKLQDFLKNLINLEIPDRIYMDSRVPN